MSNACHPNPQTLTDPALLTVSNASQAHTECAQAHTEWHQAMLETSLPHNAQGTIPAPSRIAVVGSGYVGTVVACCFAWLGHHAVGVESDPRRLEALERGHLPLHEPGLEHLLVTGLQSGRLRFTDDYSDALRQVGAVFLCIGTPSAPDGSADMRAVEAAAYAVGCALSAPAVLVTKSTVPIGGASRVLDVVTGALRRRNGDAPTVRLVHNPEFLREGTAVHDFLHPDRVVAGSDDADALQSVTRLYGPILTQSFPGGEPSRLPGFVATDVVTAETVKYACNAFLATKISFINEMAAICDLVGADIEDVAVGMGLDRRISPDFLRAGLGWGGSCFGKDLSALVTTARGHGHDSDLLSAAILVNERQRAAAVQRLAMALGSLEGSRIGLLGLAFKPGTDDVRDAPAVDLAARLLALGATVTAYDPVVSSVALPGLTIAPDPHDVAEDADAIVVATEWPDFLLLDLGDLHRRMRGDVLLDGRNLFDRGQARAAGFRHLALGRPSRDVARSPVVPACWDQVDVAAAP
ncbi:UDP-glucose dehydrogenase family protein [Geodermatophilus sp. SYSU D00703]